jgi:tRNA-specific 2-thiouridylase
VIDYFTSAYAKGFTPNPCVKCNKFIKFGKLLSLADQVGAEFLATGHYIRKKQTNTGPEESYCLLRAKDKQKDQSYFLYNLTQAQLRRILFPLGDYKKEDVKKIARENNLPVQESESQDICFLQGDHNDFLSQKIKLKPGKIVLISQNNQDQSSERRKKTIGEHQGLPLYTLGQRRGVEIGGSGPYYVVGMDYGQNILYVSSDRDDPLLYLDNFLVKNINWIEPSLPTNKTKCSVVIRYRHQGADCLVELVDKDLLAVKLKTPERAITPGQSAVFYNKEKLLGGGEISANKLK